MFGTRAAERVASVDQEVVRRLREAGAIIIGKTNVPEMTLWPFTETPTFGSTRNPWDLQHTPGGSSGGSGAAVTAGLVGGALGSDGLGSIRIPSSFCGLFGIKPQRHRISLAPHTEQLYGWHGLAVYGPIARSVRDAALFLDATAQTPPAQGTFLEAAARLPGRLRVALSTKPILPQPIDARELAAVEQTAELLRSLGHDVVQRDPDYPPWLGPHLLGRFLRGEAIPFIKLHDLLGVPSPASLKDLIAVILHRGEKLIGIGVDTVLDQMENIIKPFDPIAQQVRGFSGGTILGDGRVALLLDIPALL